MHWKSYLGGGIVIPRSARLGSTALAEPLLQKHSASTAKCTFGRNGKPNINNRSLRKCLQNGVCGRFGSLFPKTPTLRAFPDSEHRTTTSCHHYSPGIDLTLMNREAVTRLATRNALITRGWHATLAADSASSKLKWVSHRLTSTAAHVVTNDAQASNHIKRICHLGEIRRTMKLGAEKKGQRQSNRPLHKSFEAAC
jgi:hypothetical protein